MLEMKLKIKHLIVKYQVMIKNQTLKFVGHLRPGLLAILSLDLWTLVSKKSPKPFEMGLNGRQPPETGGHIPTDRTVI